MLSDALHLRLVGYSVGFFGRREQNMNARQALGFALEVQVQNIE